MTNILFICHGNICRSPMAEYVMKQLVKERKLSHLFLIASAAVSREEIGNPVYPPARHVLRQHGIPCNHHTAVQMTQKDYFRYDYLVGMDASNLRGMRRIAGGDPEQKLSLLLDYTGHPRDVADPWYSGDFETAYQDIEGGCRALLQHILSDNNTHKP